MTRDIAFLEDQPRGAEVLASVYVSLGPDPATGRPPGLDALLRALAAKAAGLGGDAIVGFCHGEPPSHSAEPRGGRPAALYVHGAVARLAGHAGRGGA